MRLFVLFASVAVPAIATAQTLDGFVPQGSPMAGVVLAAAVGLAMRLAPRGEARRRSVQ